MIYFSKYCKRTNFGKTNLSDDNAYYLCGYQARFLCPMMRLLFIQISPYILPTMCFKSIFQWSSIHLKQSWVNYFYCNRITNYFQVIVIDSNYQLLSSNCNWPQITNYSISSITNSITFQLLFKKNCLYLIVVCREITPHLGYAPWGTPPWGNPPRGTPPKKNIFFCLCLIVVCQ